ncbi:MAG: hypothetical protein KDC92_03370 [Bacteroidetes bacterium]|nr:hypothetical protein [Bacteroidota bacterium]
MIRVFAIIFLLTLAKQSFCQTTKLKIKVVDKEQKPVEYAVISITSQGFSDVLFTDSLGKIEIDVPDSLNFQINLGVTGVDTSFHFSANQTPTLTFNLQTESVPLAKLVIDEELPLIRDYYGTEEYPASLTTVGRGYRLNRWVVTSNTWNYSLGGMHFIDDRPVTVNTLLNRAPYD